MCAVDCINASLRAHALNAVDGIYVRHGYDLGLNVATSTCISLLPSVCQVDLRLLKLSRGGAYNEHKKPC